MTTFPRDLQYAKFCAYGFLKNLKFFDPFLVLFLREKGLSFTDIGLLYAIRETATNLLEIPTGLLADALGRRRTMAVSFLGYIISFLMFTESVGFPTLILAMLFFSVGEAFRTGTHKAMIFEYLRIKGIESYKVHYYGHTRAWSQTGSAISALLAALIVATAASYRSVFIASIIPYLLDLVLILSYPKELDGESVALEWKRIRQRLAGAGRNFWQTFRDRGRLGAVAAAALYSGYYKALKDYLQPVLKILALSLPLLTSENEFVRTAIVVGTVYSGIYFLTAVASRRAGTFAESRPDLPSALNRATLIGALAGGGAGLALWQGYSSLAVICFIGVYMVENLRKPISVGFVSEQVDSAILTAVLSVQSQLESLLCGLFALVLGILADRLGIGLALAILSTMLVLFLPLIGAVSSRDNRESR